MSYSAVVVPLTNVRRHPNADRLNLASALGYQVIVGLEHKDGDLGIFFVDDGVLSEDMIFHNNLSSVPVLNKDPDKKGFFGRDRRVKAQNFRGEKSYGFWTELNTVAWTDVDMSTLLPGFSFTHLNGKEICGKYINPATRRHLQSQQRNNQKSLLKLKKYLIPLKEHFDTPQLRRDIAAIPKGSILYLSEKAHGTSGRTGNLLIQRPRINYPNLQYENFRRLNSLLPHRRLKLGFKWLLERINLVLYWVLRPINQLFPRRPEYEVISGTRRVVLSQDAEVEQGWYSGKTFRIDIHRDLMKKGIPQGYTLYYEILGFDETGASIMPSQPIDKIDDKKLQKEVKKIYGDIMTYAYGCYPLNEDKSKRYRVAVYRVTYTSPDGTETELTWPQLASFCATRGLETVLNLNGPSIYDGDQKALLGLVETFLDKQSNMDPSHVIEGVCVRAEKPDGGMMIFKDKSFLFRLLEGIAKSNPETVDTEEAEDLKTEIAS